MSEPDDHDFDELPTRPDRQQPLGEAAEREFDTEAPTDAGAEQPATAEDLAAVMSALAGTAPAEPAPLVAGDRLASILESLIYAADKPLGLPQLKDLTGERDSDVLRAALSALMDSYAERGLQLLEVAGGWQFRTAPENAAWVQKLLAVRPVRLTRAQLETLAIVAYRQPITRPEIDEIRGVDSAAVIRLLLDRGLIRILGKKEEPGRPLLYGTSKEFLEFFNLKDLRDLPTLREFHELSEEHRAQVDELADEPAAVAPAAPDARPTAVDLPAVDPSEEEALLGDLVAAEHAADSASAPFKKKEFTAENAENPEKAEAESKAEEKKPTQ
ncbi:MAG TPA: SMC-Scp complex subunit ScpB [Polyangia bacterium]|nr:SMC-Scp complex subunit ScpB [Polyangia bacterium]